MESEADKISSRDNSGIFLDGYGGIGYRQLNHFRSKYHNSNRFGSLEDISFHNSMCAAFCDSGTADICCKQMPSAFRRDYKQGSRSA